MKHQYLHANIEAQVTIASIILVGVYVLIILEVSQFCILISFFSPYLVNGTQGRVSFLGSSIAEKRVYESLLYRQCC